MLETTPYRFYYTGKKEEKGRREKVQSKEGRRGRLKENTCLALVRTRTGCEAFSGSHRTPLTIF